MKHCLNGIHLDQSNNGSRGLQQWGMNLLFEHETMSDRPLFQPDQQRLSVADNGYFRHGLPITTSWSQKTIPPHLQKYWMQRKRLFSMFDEGIHIDEEGWYSVTPENIAKHIADRCRCDVIVDACCGVGGNAIQFALTCHHVIAIDMDPVRLACARHNASIYGVEDRIEFILGDVFEVLPFIKADVVFFSPPWGGVDYNKSKAFDFYAMPIDGVKLLQLAQSRVTKDVAFYLPRNTDLEQVYEVAKGQDCEVEQNFMRGKLKTVTLYFGNLIFKQGLD